MENATINIDEQELQEMMHNFPDEGNDEIFSWTITTDEGTEVELKITVGIDPEAIP